MTREELILKYILKWEEWMEESWMDYHGNDCIYLNISFLLGYWSAKFPELFEYLMKESNNTIPWKYAQDDLLDLVEYFYYPDQFNEDGSYNNWDEEKAKSTFEPWISIIDNNIIYFNRFIERAKRDFENTSYDDMHSEQQYLCDLLKEIKSYETI